MAKAPTEANTNPNAGAAGEDRKERRTIKLMSVNGIRRAGIRFPAGEPVTLDVDDLTPDQMKLLEGEKDLRPVR
ncbi:hypothetical protein [Shinella sp.]|uniref:hypothetical protein n=1 Tax=Shinella sp. TaxID=1870904 RepID=UPI00258F772A|nr:hypothetical protein [Shinella sp.]MCW5708678.1 hypothetical protein [Shinella sp.]